MLTLYAALYSFVVPFNGTRLRTYTAHSRQLCELTVVSIQSIFSLTIPIFTISVFLFYFKNAYQEGERNSSSSSKKWIEVCAPSANFPIHFKLYTFTRYYGSIFFFFSFFFEYFPNIENSSFCFSHLKVNTIENLIHYLNSSQKYLRST